MTMREIGRKLGLAAIGAVMFAGAPTMVGVAPAHAQDEADTEETVSPARRIVCRRMAAPSGSRLGARRICRTQAEWDIGERENRIEVQRQQDRSHFSSGE